MCLHVFLSALDIVGPNSSPVSRTLKGKPEDLKKTEFQNGGSVVEFCSCSLSYNLQHRSCPVYLIKDIAVIVETVFCIGWGSKSQIWLHFAARCDLIPCVCMGK